MEDSRIINLYWQRNPDAIAETNDKYGDYCFNVADNILKNHEDAEECVNDTWLRAWNTIPPQRPAKLKLFLAKITRNLAFDLYRTKSAEKRGQGEIDLVMDELSECIPSKYSVCAEYEGRELAECIRNFAKTLPVRDCNILIRRYFYAEAVSDIAKKYGMKENNVTVILHRSRKKLKEYLVKEGYFGE